jgi:DIS3-like exonuclease 1
MEVHETVAECMIFANEAVAFQISSMYPSAALLRRHPPPVLGNFSRLVKAAAQRGFTIDVSSNLALARSLDAAEIPHDPEFNRTLRRLATQAMSEAVYFSTGVVAPADWNHYGLGLTHYTHFTSPIRRYADVIVHRQLLASLATEAEAKSAMAGSLPACDVLEETATHINTKNRNSKYAQAQSLEMFTGIYFCNRPPQERVTEAVIVDLRNNGVIAYLPRYGLKGPVYLKDADGVVSLPETLASSKTAVSMPAEPVLVKGGELTKTNESIAITTAQGKSIAFRVFDHVTVRVDVLPSPYRRPDFRFELLGLLDMESSGPSLPGKGAVVKQVKQQLQSQKEMQATSATASVLAAPPSLYQTLERLRNLSMSDDDGPYYFKS